MEQINEIVKSQIDEMVEEYGKDVSVTEITVTLNFKFIRKEDSPSD